MRWALVVRECSVPVSKSLDDDEKISKSFRSFKASEYHKKPETTTKIAPRARSNAIGIS
jgi:hypothetical protein